MTRQNDEMNGPQPLLGGLEQTLIREFLDSRNLDQDALGRLSEEARHALMAEASAYASARLTEIESRSHLVRELHGT
jgi:hypothetical protein